MKKLTTFIGGLILSVSLGAYAIFCPATNHAVDYPYHYLSCNNGTSEVEVPLAVDFSLSFPHWNSQNTISTIDAGLNVSYVRWDVSDNAWKRNGLGSFPSRVKSWNGMYLFLERMSSYTLNQTLYFTIPVIDGVGNYDFVNVSLPSGKTGIIYELCFDCCNPLNPAASWQEISSNTVWSWDVGNHWSGPRYVTGTSSSSTSCWMANVLLNSQP